MKEVISKSMLCVGGTLRLLLATEAYGMGCDAPDVRRIVHISPPSSIESESRHLQLINPFIVLLYTCIISNTTSIVTALLQEMGRAGRDGLPSECLLFYNNTDIGINRGHIQQGITEFVKLETCRRQYLSEYFGSQYVNEVKDRDMCCDNCSNASKDMEMTTAPSTSMTSTKLQRDTVCSMLLSYFASENAVFESDVCTPEGLTCLTSSLARDISKNHTKYNTANALQDDFPMLDKTYVDNISSLLHFCSVESEP